MAQSPTCPVCQGQRGIPTPDGSQWQKCFQCNGLGVWTGPGLPKLYGLDFTLLANASQAGNILIKNYDFLAVFAASKQTGAFTFTIRDENTGREFQYVLNMATSQPSTGIQNANFFGTGQQLGLFPVPWRFAKKTNISVGVTDISGAGNTINITFHGADVDPLTMDPSSMPSSN